MKVIKKGNPDEDKLVIDAKQGDVYRVWNDDGKYTKLCPLYLMIGKDNNYQKVHSMTLVMICRKPPRFNEGIQGTQFITILSKQILCYNG